MLRVYQSLILVIAIGLAPALSAETRFQRVHPELLRETMDEAHILKDQLTPSGALIRVLEVGSGHNQGFVGINGLLRCPGDSEFEFYEVYYALVCDVVQIEKTGARQFRIEVLSERSVDEHGAVTCKRPISLSVDIPKHVCSEQ